MMEPAELTSIATDEAQRVELSDTLPHEGTAITIATRYGPIKVTVQGDTSKPAMVTYHDVGLEHRSCFHSFFSFPSAEKLATLLCVIHIDAPGQELDAEPLPEGYVFPSLDQLAEQVENVVAHFKLRRFVGMGAGVGGNILMRYALRHPEKLYGLVLCGTVPGKPGWIEWGYLHAAIMQLHYSGVVSPFVQDTLLSYYYSPDTIANAVDLIEAHRLRWARRTNARNLSLFLGSVVSRSDLRPKIKANGVVPQVLIAAGHHSPQVDEIEEFNGSLNPLTTSYVKVWGTANHVQEEQPASMVKSVMLFLQGLGLPTGTVIRLNEETRKTPAPATSLYSHQASDVSAANYDAVGPAQPLTQLDTESTA